MTIDDPTRYYAYNNGGFGSNKCDRDLAEGWYKFLNRQMTASHGYGNRYCDARAQGYLKGGHPSVGHGIVTRKVCFYLSGYGSCYNPVYIKVRNCGSFYVYKLKPTPNCDLRYCTTR